MSIPSSCFKAKVLAWLKSSYTALGGVVTEYVCNIDKHRRNVTLCDISRKHGCKEMANSAEGEKEGTNRHMKSMESSGNEEDGTVNILAPREFYTVFVLIRLAE
jgi:hypothetical protein